MRHNLVLGFGLLASLVSCAGCADDEADSGASREALEEFTVCGTMVTKDDFIDTMDGNLIAVESHYRNGLDAGTAIGLFGANLVLNGLDFAVIDSYEATYSDGEYRFGNDEQGIALRLYFAKDVGDYDAGDPLPYSVLDPSSYVSNVSAEVTIDGLDSSISYTFDEGPLYGLVKGDIEFPSGISDLDSTFMVKLDGDLIAFEVESTGVYYGSDPERMEDRLSLKMTTTRASVASILEQFESGGYGYDLGGTQYDSVYYDLQQSFDDSPFRLKRDDEGWYWEGTYDSTVTKGANTFYQHGFASNREDNYTEYYCDGGHETRVGIAHHNEGLFWGKFVFDADQSFLYYGIVPY